MNQSEGLLNQVKSDPVLQESNPNPSFVISSQSKVAAVLERYPQTLDLFLNYGFTLLKNPIMRQKTARYVSLEYACKFKGVNLEEFLKALNEAIKS